jgi:hypothetical protein
MTTVDGRGHWRGSGNPFPQAAVARISELQPAVLTIKTAAVREVDRLIDSYLDATRAPEAPGRQHSGEHLADAGRVFVIEGDYGTGKTHLAIEILDHVEGTHDDETRAFYYVAPGGTFLTLYTDLMSKVIGSGEVLGRVREFYADIVADALRDRPFTDPLVGQLERGDADPQLVIDRYGLKEGALREELRQRLRLVSSDEAFSRALMLLLQPELRDVAWDWFVGGVPSRILVERGIAKPIQTDAQALEALGVIARLYGCRNRRFVLVVDELEKLVLGWDRSDRAKAQTFKKLLEVFHGAGALLVVCGLPDIFAVLPRDPDRIDAIIQPSLLSDDDVRWYIEETLERAYGRRALEPFSEESIKYIVYLTGGVAREVLKLSYYAYEYASETGYEITSSVVNSVARRRSPGGGVEMVQNEIGQLLFEQGWQAERRRPLGGLPEVIADFWIPTGQPGSGCAIFLSGSILEESQARRLAERLAAIRSADPGLAVVVVVTGYLPAKLRQPLVDALGADRLIVYNPRTFDKEFMLAVNGVIERAGPTPPGTREAGAAYPELRALYTETERVARQQANALRLMQELAERTEDRLNVIQRTLETTGRASPVSQAPPADLPAELEEMFGAARHSLAAYGDVRKFVDETFEITTQEPGTRFSLTHRLREPDAFSPVGVAAFLSDLLASFRENIRAWLAARGRGGSATPGELERLRGICRTYDALYGVAPLFKLDPLPDMTSITTGEHEVLARASRSARREALRSAFDGLGDRVYRAAMNLAGGRGPGC